MSNEQKPDGGADGQHPIVGLPDGWHCEPSSYADPDITHVVWPEHGAASIHWRRRSVAPGWCIPPPVPKENRPRGKRWRAELADAAIKLLRDAWPNDGAQLRREPSAAAEGRSMPMPKSKDVGRYGDMSRSAHLRVGLDNENDVYVSVWDENGGASVEFCTPGIGGGKSSRTREALIALMLAMEADNAECPSRDWWAVRNGSNDR